MSFRACMETNDMQISFSDKLDELCVAVEGKISADTEEKIIALIDNITEALILPQKERLVV